MRVLSCFFCLWCGGILLTQGYKMSDRLSLVQEVYEDIRRNCSMVNGFPEESVDDGYAEVEDGQCTLACILRKGRLLNDDGFFVRDTMDGITAFIYEGSPDLIRQARQMSLVCEKKLAGMKISDDCNAAYRLVDCFREKWKVLELKG